MFGMEKKSKKPFAFDLELEMTKSPAAATQMQKSIDEKIVEIKSLLRQGGKSQEFEQYGVLLQGYVALQRTLKRIARKK